jgi:hypothetical protein
MESNLPLLSTGEQAFEKIRSKGMIYVDKTGYLPGLHRMGKVVFLARPRRFGKSLTVSTLDSFHSGRYELFKGLAAEPHLKSEDFVKRPVLAFDMSSIAVNFSKDELEATLFGLVHDNAKRHGVSAEGNNPAEAFRRLIRNVREGSGQDAVVIVDEYDAPVLALVQKEKESWNHGLINDTRDVMSGFYTQIKAESSCIEYAFITGISKFSRMGVFSKLNNVTDITLDTRYGAFVGFTHDEMKTYYSDYIAETADSLGMTEADLLDKMMRWYDGFSFDGVTSLYNPFSVIQFLIAGEFDNFWMESGSDSFVREFIRKETICVDQLSGTIVNREFAKSPGEIGQTSATGFLYQAGYLCLRKSSGNEYRLDFPNNEVFSALSRMFLTNMFRTLDIAVNIFANLNSSFTEGNLSAILESMSRMYSNIPYDDYSSIERTMLITITSVDGKSVTVKSFSEAISNILGEGFYRSLLLSFLHGAGGAPSAERHLNLGRPDLNARFGSFDFAIEMKTAENINGTLTAAKDGMRQIRDRGYGESFPNPILMSIAIDKERRNIGASVCEKNGIEETYVRDDSGRLTKSGAEET